MNVTYLLCAVVLVIVGCYMARRALDGRVRREPIDVNVVLDEKYPNRRRRAEPVPAPAPAAVPEPALDADLGDDLELDDDPELDAELELEAELDWDTALSLPPTPDPMPSAQRATMAAGATSPAPVGLLATAPLPAVDPQGRRRPDIFVTEGIGDEMPGWLPLPCEPPELIGTLRPGRERCRRPLRLAGGALRRRARTRRSTDRAAQTAPRSGRGRCRCRVRRGPQVP